MRCYQDNRQAVWFVRVDVAAARRIRAFAGLDVLVAGRDRADALLVALADPVAQCEALYAACQPAADARGLDWEAFARRHTGDAAEHAAAALLAALGDFYPDPDPADEQGGDGGGGGGGGGGNRDPWAAVDELAGVAGVDPAALTLGQLSRMAKARDRAAWERAAMHCAVVVNNNPYRPANAKPAQVDDFNPYATAGGRRARRRRQGFVLGEDASWEVFAQAMTAAANTPKGP